jgi:hypothetical protein
MDTVWVGPALDMAWVGPALLGAAGALLVSFTEAESMFRKWSKAKCRPPELQVWPPFVAAHLLRLFVAGGVCALLGSGPFGTALTGIGAITVIRSVSRGS